VFLLRPLVEAAVEPKVVLTLGAQAALVVVARSNQAQAERVLQAKEPTVVLALVIQPQAVAVAVEHKQGRTRVVTLVVKAEMVFHRPYRGLPKYTPLALEEALMLIQITMAEAVLVALEETVAQAPVLPLQDK
jgi:hypothetical protein